jgi:protein-tyrosine-phosphatase
LTDRSRVEATVALTTIRAIDGNASDVCDVLILCTGNQCRSPMAEALLRRRLASAGIDATVSSAGLLDDGVPASAHGVRVMLGVGLDLSEHRSRTMRPELLEHADLILCMARVHLREAALMHRASFARTFTLKELVRNGEAAGGREPGEALEVWLARVGADRRPTDLLGQSDDDDVADPIGGPVDAYERTARELDELLERLVSLIVPRAQQATA